MAVSGKHVPLNSREGQDLITTTEKVTSPYFSDGNVQLLASSITTESLSSTNEKYFFGLSNSSTLTTPEFQISFGSSNGYGGDNDGGDIKSPTAVVYNQFASLLLPPSEVTGGFVISSPASHPAVASGKDSEIYILTARRSLMKDRVNKKTWTVVLSGSNSKGLGTSPLSLTDDSINDSPTSTPAGDRYNIVSGSAGTIVSASSARNFGFFYPDLGVMVLSANELSRSIPGPSSSMNLHQNAVNVASTSAAGSEASAVIAFPFSGLMWSTSSAMNANTALRLANCLMSESSGNGSSMKFRDEEDQTSKQYFCRIHAGEMNFSNNPTFVSGSRNELRHDSMKDSPNTFITQVQLYNSSHDLVAVGNLSTPLKKNFSSEATIKVKLTY